MLMTLTYFYAKLILILRNKAIRYIYYYGKNDLPSVLLYIYIHFYKEAVITCHICYHLLRKKHLFSMYTLNSKIYPPFSGIII